MLGTGNYANSNPTSRVYQDVYKFIPTQSETTIVMRSTVNWINYTVVDSYGTTICRSSDPGALRTIYLGNSGRNTNYKHTLNLAPYNTYYLIVSSSHSNIFGSRTERNINVAQYALTIGEPMYINGSQGVVIGSTISLPKNAWSSYSTITIPRGSMSYSSVAVTANLSFSSNISGAAIELHNLADSRVYRPSNLGSSGRLSFYPSTTMNTPAYGTWRVRFNNSTAISSFIPRMSLAYAYQFGGNNADLGI